MSSTLWSDGSAADGRSSRRSCHPRPAPFYLNRRWLFWTDPGQTGPEFGQTLWGNFHLLSIPGRAHRDGRITWYWRLLKCPQAAYCTSRPSQDYQIGQWHQYRGCSERASAGHPRIQSHLLKKEIDWRFNAPGASHHGGFWERLIRSIRKVILGLTHEQALTDDGLMTLLAEVESILNGRPLTRCSTDPRDLDSLTPQSPSPTQGPTLSSPWRLRWEWPLCQTALAPGPAPEQCLLAKVVKGISHPSSGAAEVVTPSEKCVCGWHCLGGGFNCTQIFLADGESRVLFPGSEWRGQQCSCKD